MWKSGVWRGCGVWESRECGGPGCVGFRVVGSVGCQGFRGPMGVGVHRIYVSNQKTVKSDSATTLSWKISKISVSTF